MTGISAIAIVKTLLLKFVGKIVRSASRETRVNFSLAILADEVRSQSGLENWKLFNRIYGRFLN